MKKLTIKDLEFANKLTPEFRDHLERFFPWWLDSLIPYYEEAKAIGADLFKLADCKPCGAECELYDKNGIGYYYSDHPWIKELSFNSDYKYINCYWFECFEEFYPRIKEDWRERIGNFCVYNMYLHRPWNLEEEYDCMAKRVDEYFKDITHDPDVTFMLSRISSICLNPRAVSYIKHHYTLE